METYETCQNTLATRARSKDCQKCVCVKSKFTKIVKEPVTFYLFSVVRDYLLMWSILDNRKSGNCAEKLEIDIGNSTEA